jgi:polar amino acid transport system substrate-binding protein
MDRFQSNGRLIAGVSFDIPSKGYKNPQSGAIVGFEADLARAVGEKILGSADRVNFFQVMDAERIEDLQEGCVDFVVSQLTITPDRDEQVDFSTPYCVTREGLLVPKGAPSVVSRT